MYSQSEIRLLEMKVSKAEKIQAALNDLIDAWERLPGGRNYPSWIVRQWLSEDMSPSINEARKILGRKPNVKT